MMYPLPLMIRQGIQQGCTLVYELVQDNQKLDLARNYCRLKYSSR